MKTTSIRVLLLSLLIFMITAPPTGDAAREYLSVQTDDQRNGNWWQQRSRLEKLQYVTGFYDGVTMGGRFAYWGLVHDQKTTNCLSKVDRSFSEYADKYLGNTTAGQIADGLDVFYEDYRNRSLSLVDAVWLVLNEIHGKPRAEMDKMIENFRKNAKP